MNTRGEIEVLVERHVQCYFTDKTSRSRRRIGSIKLLAWLEPIEYSKVEESSWQERWDHLGESADDWLAAAGAATPNERATLSLALQTLMLEGIIRPSYAWLLRTPQHKFYEKLRVTTEREHFEQLLAAAPAAMVSAATVKQAQIVLGKICVHTGKHLHEITTVDILEFTEAARATGRFGCGVRVAHQLLRQVGWITDPPLTSGSAIRLRKPTVAERIESYGITCIEVRELLVQYLTERAVAIDYPSISQLTARLGKMFWRDIELHHPEVTSIRLPRSVIEAWRKRQEVLPDGRPRKDVADLFLVVRSFYLDLAQWAGADPARWGRYVCPSPISAADLRAHRRAVLHRQARIHERIRTLLPVLPRLLAHVRAHRVFAGQLLAAVEDCGDGETVVLQGRTYVRVVTSQRTKRPGLGSVPIMVRRHDAPNHGLINCRDVEEDAFWVWAVVEVLRLTGIRVEELLELTHLSIKRTIMTDNQQVLLLQIAPSKRDRERVLPVCPELAHVLATIVTRIRTPSGRVPVVERFDPLEKAMSAPLPYLFQRQWRSQGAVMNPGTVGALLTKACRRAELMDATGASLRLTPHDFRRFFATEAVNGGLPIHIAAKLLGHLDLNTTKGYVAVYPEEVIRQYQGHLLRRRGSRPAIEYREPSEQEWEEFSHHFRHRKMALGDCYRPYGTPCPHEHACVRCPMLRMDPMQLPRLLQIEENTKTLLAEAREHGWDGEVQGLEETLHHLGEKKAQGERMLTLPS
jgi:Phage integrase family